MPSVQPPSDGERRTLAALMGAVGTSAPKPAARAAPTPALSRPASSDPMQAAMSALMSEMARKAKAHMLAEQQSHFAALERTIEDMAANHAEETAALRRQAAEMAAMVETLSAASSANAAATSAAATATVEVVGRDELGRVAEVRKGDRILKVERGEDGKAIRLA